MEENIRKARKEKEGKDERELETERHRFMEMATIRKQSLCCQQQKEQNNKTKIEVLKISVYHDYFFILFQHV